jgi:hypothetical protein
MTKGSTGAQGQTVLASISTVFFLGKGHNHDDSNYY